MGCPGMCVGVITSCVRKQPFGLGQRSGEGPLWAFISPHSKELVREVRKGDPGRAPTASPPLPSVLADGRSRGKSEVDSVPLVLGAAQVAELPPHLPRSVTKRAGSHAGGSSRPPCQATAFHLHTAFAPFWLWARAEFLPLSGFVSWSGTLTAHLRDSFWDRLPQPPTRPRPSGTGTNSECCTGCSCRRRRCLKYPEPRTRFHFTQPRKHFSPGLKYTEFLKNKTRVCAQRILYTLLSRTSRRVAHHFETSPWHQQSLWRLERCPPQHSCQLGLHLWLHSLALHAQAQAPDDFITPSS